MTNMKQTQDDRTIQPFNCSTIQRVKAYAFTLAETLIVIGIIGVVAALTLPNLNHATGDKETVTRLMKAYSALNEANDRAIATYGPISEWGLNKDYIPSEDRLYLSRIAEFMKISKSCQDSENENLNACDSYRTGIDCDDYLFYQLADGMTFTSCGTNLNCYRDVCTDELYVDINGPNKGKNESGKDIFMFRVYESKGIIPIKNDDNDEEEANYCLESKDAYECTWWVLEYGNLDYLKADADGVCPNGVQLSETQTSCN